MRKENHGEISYSRCSKTDRITHLVDNLYAKMPVIESARAKLITESYKATEDEPIITRRGKAFAHILHNIPIIIRVTSICILIIKGYDNGNITREFAQELMDCIWVKLNDLNKCRDAASAEGFAGYSLFSGI